MRARVLALLAIAGCGGADEGTGPPLTDANDSCMVFVSFDPLAPKPGDTVRASASVSGVSGPRRSPGR